MMPIEEIWSIELGQSIGPFHLGSTIAEVIQILKNRMPIRPLEISYNTEAPYHNDVIITSEEDGFRLIFSSDQQVLMKIEFYELHKVALKYGRVVIFGGDVAGTFNSIYNLFGPTQPGIYDEMDQNYILSYEGGCIKFPIPVAYRDLYRNSTELPIEFPNGSTPAAIAFSVYAGTNYQYPSTPKFTNKYYGEKVFVSIHDNCIDLQFTMRKRKISLGDSPQYIISELGQPVSILRKSEDPNNSANIAGGFVNDYFHNYPHLGMDLMYNASHQLIKVILRTNALGHPDFGLYQKCHFQLQVFKDKEMMITPEMPWENIKKVCGMRLNEDNRPIVLDSGLGLHPFGSTLCYTSPQKNMIFEVMKNGYLASITLLK